MSGSQLSGGCQPRARVRAYLQGKVDKTASTLAARSDGIDLYSHDEKLTSTGGYLFAFARASHDSARSIIRV
jgi:hypothetical protein